MVGVAAVVLPFVYVVEVGAVPYNVPFDPGDAGRLDLVHKGVDIVDRQQWIAVPLDEQVAVKNSFLRRLFGQGGGRDIVVRAEQEQRAVGGDKLGGGCGGKRFCGVQGVQGSAVPQGDDFYADVPRFDFRLECDDFVQVGLQVPRRPARSPMRQPCRAGDFRCARRRALLSG